MEATQSHFNWRQFSIRTLIMLTIMSGIVFGVIKYVYHEVPVSQLSFLGPEGMRVQWDENDPDAFFIVPERKNFIQGRTYRLQLTKIPDHSNLKLFLTIELPTANARTKAYLAHNAVPVPFTSDDFDQVSVGKPLTKVAYIPDPEFQELALASVETLVSNRLDPGVDPVEEAERRGSILAILRFNSP